MNRTPTNCYVLCMPSTSICPLSIFCLQGLCRVEIQSVNFILPTSLPTDLGITERCSHISMRSRPYSESFLQPNTSYHSSKNYLYQIKAKERHHCRPSAILHLCNLSRVFFHNFPLFPAIGIAANLLYHRRYTTHEVF